MRPRRRPHRPTPQGRHATIELSAQIELTGLEEAIAQALRLATEEAIAAGFQLLRERAREQFLTEGAAYGNLWQARKRQTPRPRANRILERTGRLRRSFTDADSPEHIERIEQTLAGPGSTPIGIFGSAVPYAHFHQRGTSRMPARPILTEELLGGTPIETNL